MARHITVVGAGVVGLACAWELARRGASLEIIRINHDADSGFPNGIPNPLLPENQPMTSDAVLAQGADLLEMEPEERAAAGLFLAFQYPVEIPGVNNTYFLRAALNAQRRARGEAIGDVVHRLRQVISLRLRVPVQRPIGQLHGADTIGGAARPRPVRV